MKFQRRSFLRGFGGAVVGLPWLEAIEGKAHAQTGGPRRFLVFFEHGGTLCSTTGSGRKESGRGIVQGSDAWAPKPGEALQLGAIHQPLTPFVDSLLVLRGIDNVPAKTQGNFIGGGHYTSNVTALTAAKTGSSGVTLTSQSPSIDQVLATRLGQRSPTKVPSLHLLVPGLNYGSPFFRGAGERMFGEFNPIKAFDNLFTGVTVGGETPDPAATLARAQRKSVLDGVSEGLGLFSKRVSTVDRRSIEAHLEHIRALEKNLAEVTVSASCTKPARPDLIVRGASSSNPDPLFQSFGPARAVDVSLSGPLMADIMVAAFRCGLTNVGAFEIGDAYGPWFNPTYKTSEGHALGHAVRDVGMTGPQAARWQQWYDTMLRSRQWRMGLLARVLDGLTKTREGAGNMLDNSLVVATSEFSCAGLHTATDLPVLLAGKAGGRLRGGRHINYNTRAVANPETLDYQTTASNGNLFTSILNLFGFPDEHFGSTDLKHTYVKGPLPRLL